MTSLSTASGSAATGTSAIVSGGHHVSPPVDNSAVACKALVQYAIAIALLMSATLGM